MDLSNLSAILAAAGETATKRDPRAEMLNMLAMFALMGVMFYLLLIRPQRKKAAEHAQLLKAIRPKDKILTTGGILAEVITVKEKSVTIRSADSKMEITKSAIAEIVERAGEASEA